MALEKKNPGFILVAKLLLSIGKLNVKITFMRGRICIAINLPADTKKQLLDYQNQWQDLPCRWTKKDNLHITLSFLGYLSNEELLNSIAAARDLVFKHEPFLITLEKIIYGPPEKPPRMIWAVGEESSELAVLQNDLRKALAGYSAEKLSCDKTYSPHITLGRLREWEFRRIDLEERPSINEKIHLTFEVTSVEIMESYLKKSGPEYAALESFPLKY